MPEAELMLGMGKDCTKCSDFSKVFIAKGKLGIKIVFVTKMGQELLQNSSLRIRGWITDGLDE